jgi:hypothetical protein
MQSVISKVGLRRPSIGMRSEKQIPALLKQEDSFGTVLVGVTGIRSYIAKGEHFHGNQSAKTTSQARLITSLFSTHLFFNRDLLYQDSPSMSYLMLYNSTEQGSAAKCSQRPRFAGLVQAMRNRQP